MRSRASTTNNIKSEGRYMKNKKLQKREEFSKHLLRLFFNNSLAASSGKESKESLLKVGWNGVTKRRSKHYSNELLPTLNKPTPTLDIVMALR
ncbi:CLUMA_CG011838, isoform A [Clunio marinus]|uniref:CLUMA_CG011838, isoform A n=1 Tax=Clunio marinus TaxID=568069 RepID=A0A1J1IJ65_9DIPT|nr:CLUMA_CG011838, isoform A [Clunio marinus]